MIGSQVTRAVLLYLGLVFCELHILAMFMNKYLISLTSLIIAIWAFTSLFRLQDQPKLKFKKQYKIMNPNKERKNKGG